MNSILHDLEKSKNSKLRPSLIEPSAHKLAKLLEFHILILKTSEPFFEIFVDQSFSNHQHASKESSPPSAREHQPWP
ncbi:hypothetical protein EYC84_003568 [Monilinia fructicola]|uniref:Uncharacterized protein n=1 Tax=Monilinia fructicola TaxID=38448 RepID=A0A5M9JYR0_MONFR|nr:hypothetical protein EYC84_003568 [Monilinia fructicola]